MHAARANLKERIGDLLAGSRQQRDRRREATVRAMEEIDRRLRHVAFLVADWNLRFVIPRLRDLGRMFPHAGELRKEGVCDLVAIDFKATPEYPVQARVCVAMRPDPPAERIRVTLSVVMIPVYLPYDRESWIDLWIQNPDTDALEAFLDAKILRFVKDYLRVKDPESPYHEDLKVTDPVCQMTFSSAEAAASIRHGDRTYYFCIEGCRKKFETAPERYVKT